MLRVVSRVSLLAAFVFVAACSSNDKKDESSKVADLVDFERSVKHKRLWSVSTGEGEGRKHLRLEPAIVNDTIYVGNADGKVRAITLANGKTQWKVATDTALSGGVGAYHGTVAFGTLDGIVVALDAETGAERWRAQVSSEILASPAVNNSVVVVQTIDARVFAFDTQTGTQVWAYDHLTPVLSLRGTSGPVISSTQVVCAFDNGQVVSFSVADGSRTWEARVSQPKGKTDLERIVDIDGSPLIEGGLVYAAGYQGNIMAFSRANGDPIWREPVSTANALTMADDKIFVSTDNARIIAFNATNGEVAWENAALLNRGTGAPTAVGDYIITVDADDYLHVLAQKDGSFVHRFKPAGDGFHAQAQAHLGKLYLLSDDGKLSAYTLSSR